MRQHESTNEARAGVPLWCFTGHGRMLRRSLCGLWALMTRTRLFGLVTPAARPVAPVFGRVGKRDYGHADSGLALAGPEERAGMVAGSQWSLLWMPSLSCPR